MYFGFYNSLEFESCDRHWRHIYSHKALDNQKNTIKRIVFSQYLQLYAKVCSPLHIYLIIRVSLCSKWNTEQHIARKRYIDFDLYINKNKRSFWQIVWTPDIVSN